MPREPDATPGASGLTASGGTDASADAAGGGRSTAAGDGTGRGTAGGTTNATADASAAGGGTTTDSTPTGGDTPPDAGAIGGSRSTAAGGDTTTGTGTGASATARGTTNATADAAGDGTTTGTGASATAGGGTTTDRTATHTTATHTTVAAASAASGGGRGRDAVGTAVTVAVVLGLWYLGAFLLSVAGDPVATAKLPYPHLIVERVVAAPGTLLEATWATVSRALLGFVIGAAAAAAVSIVLTQARWIESSFMPYVLASQMLPTISLVPIARTVLNSDEATRLFMAAFITFFSVTVAMVRGLKAASPDAHELLRSYGAGRVATLRYLRLPASLPLFFSGLRVGAPLSLVGAIVVDLMGATTGLGYLMLASLTYGPAHAPLLWAAMLTTLALGACFARAVALAERVLVGWQPSFRAGGE